MNTIPPGQAARIARDVYEIELKGISRALKITDGLSLQDPKGISFQRPAEKFTGRTGFIKKQAGFGYVAEGEGHRKDHYLVALRGTTGPIGISRDWQTNYRINTSMSKNGYPVHAGFQSVFEDFLSDLEAYFRGKRGTIHFLGHSLGGALATLAADYFAAAKNFTIYLYTFGAPRVGLEGFCRNLTKEVTQKNIFRMYHANDPVPMIAPFPYMHAPFTSMKELNWGLCIPSFGKLITASDHSKLLYVKTAEQYADWNNIGNNNMLPYKTWEVWLKEMAERKYAGILQFGSDVMAMITQCIGGILEASLGCVGITNLSGVTMADQLAWILERGTAASKNIAINLKSLMQVIFRFLGRPVTPPIDLTVAMIRYVLNLLFTVLQNMAGRALSLFA